MPYRWLLRFPDQQKTVSDLRFEIVPAMRRPEGPLDMYILFKDIPVLEEGGDIEAVGVAKLSGDGVC